MAKKKHTETPEDRDAREASNKDFAEKIKSLLAAKKNWTAETTAALVKTFIRDQNGQPKELAGEDKDIVDLICNPTVELQMRILDQVLKRNGVELNKFELGHIRRVMNPQIFRGELVDAGKITVQVKPPKANLEELLVS